MLAMPPCTAHFEPTEQEPKVASDIVDVRPNYSIICLDTDTSYIDSLRKCKIGYRVGTITTPFVLVTIREASEFLAR